MSTRQRLGSEAGRAVETARPASRAESDHLRLLCDVGQRLDRMHDLKERPA